MATHERVQVGAASPKASEPQDHIGQEPRAPIAVRDAADGDRTDAELKDLLIEARALIPDAVLKVDMAGHIVTCSSAVEHIFGWSADELVGQPVDVLMPERYHSEHDALLANFASGDASGRVIAQNRVPMSAQRRDGTEFAAEISISSTMIDGEPHLMALVRDISERRRSQAKTNLFIEVLETYGDAIALTDPHGNVSWANTAAHTMLGLDASEESNAFDAFGAASARVIRSEAIPQVLNVGWWSEELPIARTGFELACHVTVQGHRDVVSGEIEGLWVAAHDISALKAAQDELLYAATHDSLTGLANRQNLRHHMGSVLGSDEDRADCAVLFIDLDRFKCVNDTFGHETGDAVLVEVAARLNSQTRESDMVARLGGDEFVVVCGDTDPSRAGLLAARIVEAISEPFVIGTKMIEIGASIGVARVANYVDTDVDELLRLADRAAYEAKRTGRSRVVEYSDA